MRLGFYGTRGGVGVSTAALQAARALASEGQRVGLFDATGRGDLHLMAGIELGERPVTHGGITFFLERPTEETVRGFDAAIVDGGRRRGHFNAEWIAVSRPLSEDHVRRLAGLGSVEEAGEGIGEGSDRSRRKPGRKKKGRGLAGLISIEVTE